MLAGSSLNTARNARTIQEADQHDRAALYAALDVSATYDPATGTAELPWLFRVAQKTRRREVHTADVYDDRKVVWFELSTR